ncbi:MFS transporter [Fulvivirga sediminis]|uniref:MFS transporter n=1 Tax=Fulvivirga sediminis TaxID=2803949 RepID=A0A937K239_9BACT|nr:MFS transporter [Fulvivirga sediminis]MBL3658151.1 MFS transporter [Fulvivirga sediminis]
MDNLRKSRIGIGAVFFAYGLCFASWASRIPSIQQAMELSDSALGLVLFALPVGSLISLPLSGYLVARYGSKIVVIISASIYTFALTGIGWAFNLFTLIPALFAFGLVGNTLNIAINTQAVSLEGKYGRNILATFHGMWSLAGFAGAGIGAYMIAESILTQYHFMIVWVLALSILLFSFRFLLSEDTADNEPKPIFAWPEKSLLLLGIIAFCSMISEGAMFDWSGVYLKKVVQVKQDWVGIGYAAFMVAMAGSRLVADKLTHHLGVTKMLQVSGLLTGIGLLIIVIFPKFIICVIGLLIVGVGVSSVVPLVYSMAGKSKQMSSSAALASVSTFGFLGFLAGPPIIGLISGAVSLKLAFALLSLMGIIVFLLSRKLSK